MSIRTDLEQLETLYLSKYAQFSSKSLGRETYEEECDIRTCYMRDRDRIIHSKSFRRLKHKTQVFIIPEGDHYRTRLTHTLEVSQIARTIAKALRLNEELTEAISLGHDLGHTPFGHTGERILNELLPNGFEHCKQSVRIVKRIEKNGKGLNLTKEVIDGILNHRTKGNPNTLEGKIVRISDKIAYINHDIDDAINANIMKESDIPVNISKILGNTVRIRINTLVKDVIKNSYNINDIKLSEEIEQFVFELRNWMFNNVYYRAGAKEEENKAEELIRNLYNYYLNHLNDMPSEYINLINDGEDDKQVVADYISGMTDDYAILKFERLFVPTGWKIN